VLLAVRAQANRQELARLELEPVGTPEAERLGVARLVQDCDDGDLDEVA
jgi:hypothetical protein